MTPEEEILNLLKSRGLDPNDPQWVKKKTVDLGQLGSVVRQRELLAVIQKALENQQNDDMVQLDLAKESLAKLRRGGGG